MFFCVDLFFPSPSYSYLYDVVTRRASGVTLVYPAYFLDVEFAQPRVGRSKREAFNNPDTCLGLLLVLSPSRLLSGIAYFGTLCPVVSRPMRTDFHKRCMPCSLRSLAPQTIRVDTWNFENSTFYSSYFFRGGGGDRQQQLGCVVTVPFDRRQNRLEMYCALYITKLPRVCCRVKQPLTYHISWSLLLQYDTMIAHAPTPRCSFLPC